MKHSNTNIPDEASSPFGATGLLRQVLSTHFVSEMYMRKCGANISPCFRGVDYIGLYECQRTGYKFWRPDSVAGNEDLYKLLYAKWKNYYRRERWEYKNARKLLKSRHSVLEIGCGRGFFLKSIEDAVTNGLGLELNNDAISNKATKFPMVANTIQKFARTHSSEFDCIFSFQVLEHVIDPFSFIESALNCLRPSGLLVLSTPNNDNLLLKAQEDAFDLPPHHMGHFSPATYIRISDIFNIKETRIICEPRKFSRPRVSTSTLNNIFFRGARVASAVLLNAAYFVAGETGSNMLVIFRRPGESV